MRIVIEALRLKHRRIIFHQALLKDLLVPLIQVVCILSLLTVDSNGWIQINLGYISISQTLMINRNIDGLSVGRYSPRGLWLKLRKV